MSLGVSDTLSVCVGMGVAGRVSGSNSCTADKFSGFVHLLTATETKLKYKGSFSPRRTNPGRAEREEPLVIHVTCLYEHRHTAAAGARLSTLHQSGGVNCPCVIGGHQTSAAV